MSTLYPTYNLPCTVPVPNHNRRGAARALGTRGRAGRLKTAQGRPPRRAEAGPRRQLHGRHGGCLTWLHVQPATACLNSMCCGVDEKWLLRAQGTHAPWQGSSCRCADKRRAPCSCNAWSWHAGGRGCHAGTPLDFLKKPHSCRPCGSLRNGKEEHACCGASHAATAAASTFFRGAHRLHRRLADASALLVYTFFLTMQALHSIARIPVL